MKNKMIHSAILAALILGFGRMVFAEPISHGPTYRVGTAGNVNVYDEGYGQQHITTLIFTNLSLNNFANGSSANGILLYTLPTGSQIVEESRINLALQSSNGTMHTATPVAGIGSVKATGAVNVLSGTATFQDIMAGQTGTANGATFNGNVATVLSRATSKAKTIYLNSAGTWGGNGSVLATGKIIIKWTDWDVQ